MTNRESMVVALRGLLENEIKVLKNIDKIGKRENADDLLYMMSITAKYRAELSERIIELEDYFWAGIVLCPLGPFKPNKYIVAMKEWRKQFYDIANNPKLQFSFIENFVRKVLEYDGEEFDSIFEKVMANIINKIKSGTGGGGRGPLTMETPSFDTNYLQDKGKEPVDA